MDIKQLAKDHLKDSYVLQLATSHGDQPWVCNVHFFADDNLNLYWMSDPATRHSEDIAANPRVAAAVAVNEAMPLIGVQIEGDAEQLEFTGHDDVLQRYAARHERDDFIKKAVSGELPFKLYRLAPRVVQIFDLKNFPKSPKQEWRA